jgi:hypothetical protein
MAGGGMSGISSMQYTIGTALDRAHESGYVVELLVESHWVTGQVVACDGIGVVLDNDGREHCVVRLESIAAVRVGSEAPMRRKISAARPMSEARTFDGAMPMPSPRAAAD